MGIAEAKYFIFTFGDIVANHFAVMWMQCSRQAPSWRRMASFILIAGFLFSIAPANGQSASAPATTFIIGFDAAPDTYSAKWFSKIYTEAFRRLGIPVLLESYALKRRGIQAESGGIDGEANRAYGYGATHPALVRVEESVVDLNLGLYTASPTLRLERIEDLSSGDMLVEYRRGIALCENALKPLVAVDRLSDVTTEEQGIKKLVARRTDVYCDFSLAVLLALHTPDLKGVTTVRKVLDVGKSIPTYPYLHKKHADLAPRLAATLKQMKAEGLIETYRLQVERGLGWGQ